MTVKLFKQTYMQARKDGMITESLDLVGLVSAESNSGNANSPVMESVNAGLKDKAGGLGADYVYGVEHKVSIGRGCYVVIGSGDAYKKTK